MERAESIGGGRVERQMMRHTIEKLRRANNLLECNREVDYVYEMGGVLSHYDNEVPMLFNKIKNNPMRAIGGVYGKREIIYDLLGFNKENRNYKFMEALVNPEPYKVVKNGPVKENIIKNNINLLDILPINKFHEKDSSNYIAAGVLVAKDLATQKFHTSVRRLQFLEGNKMSALFSASPRLTNDFLELESRNQPMEVAIILGYDAPLLMASQYSSATYGMDKYEIDSALRGEALELVKCETSDLLVPAYAEIVIEGRLIPGKRELEGPFGELMGYYGKQAPHPYIEVDCITYRNNPIYQVAFPCREEHLVNGLIREMEMYFHLKTLMDVKDVNISVGGGARFNGYISINKRKEGEPKTAIMSALGLQTHLKNVVIVDDDVDIYDLTEIEWALASRVQAGTDLVVIEGALGASLEPSHDLRGVTDKIGIDATKPLVDEEGNFERAIIPGYESVDISKYFPNIR